MPGLHRDAGRFAPLPRVPAPAGAHQSRRRAPPAASTGPEARVAAFAHGYLLQQLIRPARPIESQQAIQIGGSVDIQTDTYGTMYYRCLAIGA